MQISLVLGAAALLLSARMNVAAYSPRIWPPHFKESLAHNAGAGPAKRTSHFHWPTIPVTMRTTTATPTPTFNPKPEWDPCENFQYAIKESTDLDAFNETSSWVYQRAWKWVDCCHRCTRDMYNCVAARYTAWDPTMNLPGKQHADNEHFIGFKWESAGLCDLLINQRKMEGAETNEQCSYGVSTLPDHRDRIFGTELTAVAMKSGYIRGPCWKPPGLIPLMSPQKWGVNMRA